MNRTEVRQILSAYLPDETEAEPMFAEALQEAAQDPELSQWWKEEQIFDQAIAGKVQRIPVSPELKSRLLLAGRAVVPVRRQWHRQIALLAAVLALFAVIFGVRQTRLQPAASLADYRDEMMSFVKVMPPLEFETSELPRLLAHLKQSGAAADIAIPVKLRQLEPAGCRTLRFRGHDVTLICFNRPDGRRAHLFVMKDDAVSRAQDTRSRGYEAAGEWTTAVWSEGGQTYLLAMQDDQRALEKYFTTS